VSARTRAGSPKPRARGRPLGLLVAVEGIDGAGKTTLLARLEQGLRREGRKVGRWKEPSDSLLGEAARGLAAEQPAQAALLFTLDRGARAQELERLRARTDVVLCDRSYFSTLAYQGSTLSPRLRRELERMQVALVPSPDVVLWLDLPPREALRRVAARGVLRSALERSRVLVRTARAYGGYARRDPERFVRLDASEDPATVAGVALASLAARLPVRGRTGGKKSR
jgi:dTMP kinase